MRSKSLHLPVFALAALIAANLCRAQQMTVATDQPGGVYQLGDTVRWLIGWKGESNAPVAHYVFKRDGLEDAGQGNLDFSHNSTQLETKFDAPGTMLLVVTWKDADGKEERALGGAVAAPDRIPLSAPPPADFAAFWKARIKELQKVPVEPKLEKENSGKPGVVYWKIRMNNIRGTHIEGQIARPEKGKKFPALLILQWAGVYGLQKSWVTDRAAEGWLALDIEPHDLPVDKPASFYKEQVDGPLKDYWSIG
ncbi:MAG TPA: acetylxylan esterase, partial [Verrucomicrobiae bacterium]|nr:acetylxylan esterase [Verrucomicrobiae bacterium]